MNRAPTQGSPCGEGARAARGAAPTSRQADAMSSRPYPKAEARTQRETGNREGCCGHEIILGSQVSATGYQVQVFRFGYRSRA